MLDYILSLFLITGSEHNMDALPKYYKSLYVVTHNQAFCSQMTTCFGLNRPSSSHH
jgi:hypothetical protein